MKGQKGFIRFIYIIALLLLGIVIWGFFQSNRGNLSERSVALDNEVTDALNASGFSNAGIVSQSREERRSGAAVWIEYYREIKLPANTGIGTVERKLRAAALKRGCTLNLVKSEGSKTVFEMRFGDKLLSKLVVDAEVRAAAAPGAGKKIALVIDDVGYNDALGPFLDLGIPVTFAILPYEHFSKIVAAELSKKGMPYILHLPLEPEQYPKVDPGKAALLIKMTDQEIRKKFLSDLASVPGVSGVSNHMGSRFSSNPAKMRVLLELVKENNLFYFDSYTSSATKAGKIARELGVPFEENSIFVDLKDDPEFMKKQFEFALKLINKFGSCAVIGHIQKKALPGALKDVIATYRKNGVEFVYLPELVKAHSKH